MADSRPIPTTLTPRPEPPPQPKRNPFPLGAETDDTALVKGLGIGVTAVDKTIAIRKLSEDDSTFKSLARIQTLDEAQRSGGALLPPEQLNEMFPDMMGKFNAPMNARSAQLIADRQREKRILQEIIASGPEGGFLQDTEDFAAGIVPHLLDPIGILLSFSGAPVLAKVGALSTRGAGILSRAGSVASRTNALRRIEKLSLVSRVMSKDAPARVKFLRDAALGTAGNIPTEAVTAIANEQDLSDYTSLDFLMSVSMGAVGFAGLRYGLGGSIKFMRDLTDFSDIADDIAFGQALSGKRINIDPLVKEAVRGKYKAWRRMDGEGNQFTNKEYVRRPLNKVDGRIQGEGKFFTAITTKGDQITGMNRKILVDEYGGGEAIYLTKRPSLVAENAKVFEVDLENKKLVDLDLPTPKALHGAVKAELKRLGVEVKDFDDMMNIHSLRELYDEFKTAAHTKIEADDSIDLINEAAEKLGFDGTHFRGDNIMGEKIPDSDIVVLFKKDGLEIDRAITPDKSFREDLSGRERSEIVNSDNSVDRHIRHDPEGLKEHDRLLEDPVLREETRIEVEGEEKALLEEFEDASKIDLVKKSQIDEFKKKANQHAGEHTLAKGIKECLIG